MADLPATRNSNTSRLGRIGGAGAPPRKIGRRGALIWAEIGSFGPIWVPNGPWSPNCPKWARVNPLSWYVSYEFLRRSPRIFGVQKWVYSPRNPRGFPPMRPSL